MNVQTMSRPSNQYCDPYEKSVSDIAKLESTHNTVVNDNVLSKTSEAKNIMVYEYESEQAVKPA